MKKPSMTAGTKAHRTAVAMKKESMATLKRSIARKDESKFKSSEEAERFNAEALRNTLRPDFKGSPKATENTKKFMKKYNLTEIPDRVDFAKLEADRKKRKENVRVKTLPEVEVTATKMKKPATKMKKPDTKKIKKTKDEISKKYKKVGDKPGLDLEGKDNRYTRGESKTAIGPKIPFSAEFPRKLTKFDKIKMEKNKAKKNDGGRSKAKPAQKVVEKKPAGPKMKKPAATKFDFKEAFSKAKDRVKNIGDALAAGTRAKSTRRSNNVISTVTDAYLRSKRKTDKKYKKKK